MRLSLFSRRFLSALPAALALLLSACATDERVRMNMRYGVETLAPEQRVFFPPPPEIARYMYGGQLIGERNFVPEKAVKPNPLRKVVSWLTGIDEASDEPLELLRPQGVAVDDAGRVYVTDVGRQAVVIFDPVLGEVKVLKRSYAFNSFVSPTGIAVSHDGEIFVTDSEAGMVARLWPDGRVGEPIGLGVLTRPTGLVFDREQKRLLVADYGASDIKVFDTEGRLIATYGSPGKAPGEFNRPTYLAVWENELYVSDTMNARVQVLDLDSGKPLRVIGQRGEHIGQLTRPKGIALDGAGHLYVIESYHDHLLIFDRDGRFLLPIGGTGYATDNFYLPAGLWIDSRNRVYVADMFNGRIVTYHYLAAESESDD